MCFLNDFCCICLLKFKELKHLYDVCSDNISYYDKLTTTIKEMCFTELDSEKCVCNDCCDTIDVLYNFKEKCLRNKILFIDYVTRIKYKDVPGEMVVKNEPNVDEPITSDDIKKETVVDNDKDSSDFIYTKIKTEDEQENLLGDVKTELDDVDDTENIEQIDIKETILKLEPTDDETNTSEIKVSTIHKNVKPKKRMSKKSIERSLRQFKCDICLKKFISNDILVEHQNKSHSDKTFNYQCEICRKRFDKKQRLSHHKRVHTGLKPYSCKICEKRFTECGNLKTHMRVHSGERPFPCTICEKRFTQAVHLASHIETHSRDLPFECNICRRRFGKEGTMKNHRKKHENGPLRKEPEDRSFVCPTCNKQFTTGTHLNIHIKMHMGIKNFTCNVCNKKFTQACNLASHLKIHETNPTIDLTTDFDCHICLKRFTSRKGLTCHIRTHTNQKPHECNVCGKRFAQTGHLLVHSRLHSGEKPFSCSYCQRRFTQQCHLELHVRTHTGEKPYGCDVCGHRSADKSTIRKHKLMHEKHKKKGNKNDI